MGSYDDDDATTVQYNITTTKMYIDVLTICIYRHIKPYDAKIFLPSVVPTVLYIISIRQLNVPLFYVEAKTSTRLFLVLAATVLLVFNFRCDATTCNTVRERDY